MTKAATSAQQPVGYLLVLWENVVKIFLIDLLGAAVVLWTTFILASILFAIGHSIWGLRFRSVAESFLILAAIYLLVILITAVKRHFSLSAAIVPTVGTSAASQPDESDAKSAPVVDAGVSTSVSGS